MRAYFIRRLLLFIPTLFVISLASFVILIHSPGDPVERMLLSTTGTGDQIPSMILDKQRTELRHRLGLDLPVFYFSIHSLSESSFPQSIAEESKMQRHADSGFRNYVPVISFHANNQFHRWLFGDGEYSRGALRLDFGESYQTRQPVWSYISDRIGWSLFFTITSILLAYLISIPVGIKAAARKDSRFDRNTSFLFFILYSLPVFWTATLLLMIFANTDMLNWFPASGVKPVRGFPTDAGIAEKIRLTIPYLILPTICYVYSSLAFLSRLMRTSILEILKSDFITTARAKGLPEKKVLWKHALRNSLFPVITVFAHVFPAMIGGSVIIESIFTIPGMGYAIYQSIAAQDYPVLVAVFSITGLLTITGYLVSDLLYAWMDPRISFSKAGGKS